MNSMLNLSRGNSNYVVTLYIFVFVTENDVRSLRNSADWGLRKIDN